MRSPTSQQSNRSGKSLQVCLRFLLLAFALFTGYYLGRPVYWTMEARMKDFQEGVASGRSDLDTSLSPEGLDKGLVDPDLVNETGEGLTEEQRQRVEAINKKRKDRIEKAHAAVEAAKAASAQAVEEVIREESSAAAGMAVEATAGKADATETDGFAKGVRSIIHEGRPLLETLKHDIWSKPTDPTIPAKEEFALRKEMVKFRAKGNTIVVTFANFAFMDFVTTWVRHLTDAGVFNILIGAMDTKILEGLYLEGVPVFDMESGMSTVDVGWGTPIFHKMGREKITLINVFLSMDFEILICDTDMVWLQNPLPWIARWKQADVLTSSDETIKTVVDDGLEVWNRAHAAYNIGILHYRPTEPAKRQAREWAELLASDDKIWDQNGFNELMHKKWGPEVENGNGLFYAYDGNLKLGIMPVSLFCSGHTYFIQRLYKVVGLQPYAVHTTFQFAGTPGKRHRLREAKLFFDKPEYYDPPGGVVAYTPDLPEELLTGGKHTLESHFALVVHQLKQIRAALSIATLLGRTLVFPELWCRFDRMWYPHPGILTGTDTPQPLLCPLDHVFEIHKMLDKNMFPEEEFGPIIPFREYSFLENPRLPEEVSKSKLSIQLCSRGEAGCPKTPAPPAVGEILQLPQNSSQNELVEVLTKYKDVKVLDFSTMLNVFGGWDDKAMEKKFVWRIKHYLGIWCCVNAHPGHIWYDFYADQKPDYKAKPPKDGSEDHPPF